MNKEYENEQKNNLAKEDNRRFFEALPFDTVIVQSQKFEAQRSQDTHVPAVSCHFDTEGRELF